MTSLGLSFPIKENLYRVVWGQTRVLAQGLAVTRASVDMPTAAEPGVERDHGQEGPSWMSTQVCPHLLRRLRLTGQRTQCSGGEAASTPAPAGPHQASPSMLDDSIMLVSRSVQ